MSVSQRFDSLFSASACLVSGCVVPVSVSSCLFVRILYLQFPCQFLGSSVEKLCYVLICTYQVDCAKATCTSTCKKYIHFSSTSGFHVTEPIHSFALTQYGLRILEESFTNLIPSGQTMETGRQTMRGEFSPKKKRKSKNSIRRWTTGSGVFCQNDHNDDSQSLQ